MGGCESDTLSLAVRFMLAMEPSDGIEREGVGDAKLFTRGLLLPGVSSGDVGGIMGGTLGEKSETCGVLLELPASAPARESKDHVSPWSVSAFWCTAS